MYPFQLLWDFLSRDLSSEKCIPHFLDYIAAHHFFQSRITGPLLHCILRIESHQGVQIVGEMELLLVLNVQKVFIGNLGHGEKHSATLGVESLDVVHSSTVLLIDR